jgi:predicted N-acetyltransferase YhbS
VVESTYRIEPLARNHNRAGFDCGNEDLNRFLHQYAIQWAKKDLAQTRVMIRTSDPQTIVGYCSLNATRLDLNRIGGIKGFPHSAEVGAALLGKLAVDRKLQRHGIGRRLLSDAFDLVLEVRDRLGIFAMIVDAIDANAIEYYTNFGFTPFADDASRLYYPLKDYAATRRTVPR